jgi:hypothetical protein
MIATPEFPIKNGRIGLRLSDRSGELLRFLAMHYEKTDSICQRAEGLPRCEGHPRVVVSLTTIPERIGGILPTLHSIVDQTRRPDAIYLNLPEFSERQQSGYVRPSFLNDLPLLEVTPCEKDWGPATKLIPTLLRERDPETAIVVIDDDQVYPREMLETLCDASDEMPEAALASRGYRIPSRLDIRKRVTLYGTHLQAPLPIEIVQGSAGFFVKRRFFDDAVFDYSEAPKSAFFCDDVWFAGHLARRNIDRLVVPFPGVFGRLASRTNRRTLSLYHNENSNGLNEFELYWHFSDHWKHLD